MCFSRTSLHHDLFYSADQTHSILPFPPLTSLSDCFTYRAQCTPLGKLTTGPLLYISGRPQELLYLCVLFTRRLTIHLLLLFMYLFMLTTVPGRPCLKTISSFCFTSKENFYGEVDLKLKLSKSLGIYFHSLPFCLIV